MAINKEEMTEFLKVAERLQYRLGDILERAATDPLAFFGTAEDQLNYNDLVNIINKLKYS